jgi:RNA polymerase sigma-70 factor (ECF subfamily)
MGRKSISFEISFTNLAQTCESGGLYIEASQIQGCSGTSLLLRLSFSRTDGSLLDEQELTDLIRLSRLGDADAFDRLVRHYYRPIYAMAYRSLGDRDNAEDVTQETFIRAWAGLKRLKNPAVFLPWIRTIAVRACLDRVQGQQKEGDLVGRLLSQPNHGGSPSGIGKESTHDTELFLDIQSALSKMPESLRVIVQLHYYDGRSLREIARLLGQPIRTVCHRHQAALKRLYKAMEGQAAP